MHDRERAEQEAASGAAKTDAFAAAVDRLSPMSRDLRRGDVEAAHKHLADAQAALVGKKFSFTGIVNDVFPAKSVVPSADAETRAVDILAHFPAILPGQESCDVEAFVVVPEGVATKLRRQVRASFRANITELLTHVGKVAGARATAARVDAITLIARTDDVAAWEGKAEAKRIVIVLDTTGSMLVKMPWAIEFISSFVNELGPAESFAMATTSNDQVNWLQPHYARSSLEARKNLLAQMQSVVTNGRGGISTAIDAALELHPDEIELLTDGDTADDMPQLLSLVKNGGVPINTFLECADISPELAKNLRAIAAATGGKALPKTERAR